MSAVAGEGALRRRTGLAGVLAGQRETWLPLLLIGITALVERHFVVANTDVSWLLTLAERVLDGQRPYVDFIELNPPASIYLYVPGVVFARALGLAPELVTDGLIFILIGASLWVAGRILARAGLFERTSGGRLAVLATVVLAILPAQTFGEREHVAVAMFLPMLAVLMARANAKAPDFGSLLAAGIGAGLVVVIKPYLGLGVAAAVIAAAYAAKSWRVLFGVECWVAGAIVAAYGAVVMIEFPHFAADMVPLAAAMYLPIRVSWETFVSLPVLPIWVLTVGAILYFRGRGGIDARYGILLAASAGFAVAYVIQGKGWPYHSYPTLALAVLALAVAVSERAPDAGDTDRHRRRKLGVAFGLIGIMTFGWMNTATSASMSALAAPIRAAKPHPTMLAIASDIAVGHPLARAAGGTWVGSLSNVWISRGARWRQAHETLSAAAQAQIDRYVALERSVLVGDFRRAKPDIVLVEKVPFDYEAWARADRELAHLLEPYRKLVTMNDILVLERTEDAAASTGTR
jgi:hypothetical protein